MGNNKQTIANDSIHNSEQGVQDGLTKREYFAGLAMQGLCANYLRENITGWDVNTYAKESVELADALLKELNDQTENKYVIAELEQD